jgi:hydrogenase expression/formation protein HypC
MCLAVPGKIIEIDGTTAQVDFGGVTREASLILVPDAIVGEYVLVHAGFAIELLNEGEAEETLKLFRELARSLDYDRAGGSGDASSRTDGARGGSGGAGHGTDDAGDAT